MNYNGWENEETSKANFYLENDYELYRKAIEFKERNIDSDVLSYHLKDLIKMKISENETMREEIGDISKVNFKEIAKSFYND